MSHEFVSKVLVFSVLRYYSKVPAVLISDARS